MLDDDVGTPEFPPLFAPYPLPMSVPPAAPPVAEYKLPTDDAVPELPKAAVGATVIVYVPIGMD